MTMHADEALGSQIRKWIKENRKESKRLEFKKRIELTTSGGKAEFVRDVLSLANSEGECPREDGYLVIGFRDGKCHDVQAEHYDGATFGQILEAFIAPPINCSYEEFANGVGGRIGVLVVRPDPNLLYLVRQRMSETGTIHLLAGQSWGRKSDRKNELNGDAIQARIASILQTKLEVAAEPLLERIRRLEQESGASLAVKNIRFAIEGTQDDNDLEDLLQQLLPYASEFDHHVQDEVMQAVSRATDRTRYGVDVRVIRAADAVLSQLMPLASSHAPRPKPLSDAELEVIKGIANLAFDITWDACRYIRNPALVEIGARRFRMLIRLVAVNHLDRLREKFIEEVRRCEDICSEERRGTAFPEGRKILDDAVRDALDF